jgi:hypothetical protein
MLDASQSTRTGASISVIQSTNGDLNKRIALQADGTVIKDHPLPMSQGWAHHTSANTAQELKAALVAVAANKVYAITLGQLQDPNDYRLPVKSRRRASESNEICISRTKTFFEYTVGLPKWVLLDADDKYMPQSVADTMASYGGWDRAVLRLWPELVDAAAVTTASSSSHITKPDGELLSASAIHKYVLADKDVKPDELLKDLVLRGWLHGLTWWVIGAAGQLLERSIVDAAVGSPERLCFEAAPTLEGDLVRDAPEPVAVEGEAIGAPVALTIQERQKALKTRRLAQDALFEEAAEVRDSWRHARAYQMMVERGLTYEQSLATVKGLFTKASQLIGEYGIQLSDGTWTTPNEIRRDPEKYHFLDGPSILDGPEYGWSKIQIFTMTKAGSPLRKPYILDYAHGNNSRYFLIGTSAAPGVELERKFTVMSTGQTRARTRADQEGRVAVRRAYQQDMHWRFWLECEEWHRSKRRKPHDETKVAAWEEAERQRASNAPRKWDASQTGIGKSHQRNEFVKQLTKSPRFDRKKQGPLCIVVERHEHIDDVLKELEGVSVVALRGRSKHCKFPSLIGELGRVCNSVERDICQRCPLYEQCSYYQQKEEARTADVVVMPREIALGRPVNFLSTKVALWMFDEDIADTCLNEPVRITQSDLTVHPATFLQFNEPYQVLLCNIAGAIQWDQVGSPVHAAVVDKDLLEGALQFLEVAAPFVELPSHIDEGGFEAALVERAASIAPKREWYKNIRTLLAAVLRSGVTVVGASLGRTKTNTAEADGVLTVIPPMNYISLTTKADISGFHALPGPRILYSATASEWVNSHLVNFGAPDRDAIPLPSWVKLRLMDCHSGSKSSLLKPAHERATKIIGQANIAKPYTAFCFHLLQIRPAIRGEYKWHKVFTIPGFLIFFPFKSFGIPLSLVNRSRNVLLVSFGLHDAHASLANKECVISWS